MALIASIGSLPLIALSSMTVILSAAALPAENMLLARYTPSRHRSLAFGVKFVLAFSIANPAILLASWVAGRSGEFTQLYLILAAIAAVAAVEIGRAHVCTPVTNAQLVCSRLLEKKTT